MGFDSNSDISSDEIFLNKVKSTVPKVNTEKKEHKCNFLNCGKVFSRPSKLRRHQCIHTQEKTYSCTYPNCTKQYSYAWHLKRHVNNVHEKIFYKQILKCVFKDCEKELSSEFALRRHIKHVHSENSTVLNKYSCDNCSLKFKKKNQLAAHAIIHTGNQNIICNECSVIFQHITDYKKHVSNHKTYTCECGEIYHRWSRFLSHKRTEHVKTYECNKCSKVFKTKKYLKLHKEIHNNTRTVYECTFSGCPRFYYYSRNLIQHIKSYHEAERFSCTFNDCDRSFVTNQKLKNHVKTHDPNWVRRKTPQKKRRQRKDAGFNKKEMAAHLAGYMYGEEIKSDEKNSESKSDDELTINEEIKSAGCSGVLNIVEKNTFLSNIVTC